MINLNSPPIKINPNCKPKNLWISQGSINRWDAFREAFNKESEELIKEMLDGYEVIAETHLGKDAMVLYRKKLQEITKRNINNKKVIA